MTHSEINPEILKSHLQNIKVFGVGGAGIHLIEHMMKYPAPGAEFIAVHGSAQALASSSAHQRFLLGRKGLPHARASDARFAAETAANDLQGLMNSADLVLIVTAMGGATGSGASPVIGRIAQALRIPTVAVVTKPFEWETGVRRVVAHESADQLACCVDAVIEVVNQSAAQMLCVEEIHYEQGLYAVNEAIAGIAAEIIGIVNAPGSAAGWDSGAAPEMKPLSFEDFLTVMRDPGKTLVGTAVGVGPGRARTALQQALICPILEGIELSDARRILVSVTTAPGMLRSEEAQSMVELARAVTGRADLRFCATTDPGYGDRLRVTVFAVGLSRHWERPSAEWVERHRGYFSPRVDGVSG